MRYGFGGHHFFAGGLGPEGGPDIGVGGAGEQGDHTNSFGTKFFAKRVGEGERGVLGGGVGGGSGEDASGGDGKVVYDGASAFHDSEGGLRDEECTVEIGIKNIFPDGEWKLFDREVGVGDASVVDEDVEASEFATGRAEQGVDGVRVADIAGVNEYLDFGGGQFPAAFFQRGSVAGSEDEVTASVGEGAGDGKADAASSARDEGDLRA